MWHITHRCHKKEFLLKFAKDRSRWRFWLFEAKKRFGLRVLNYVVTSNLKLEAKAMGRKVEVLDDRFVLREEPSLTTPILPLKRGYAAPPGKPIGRSG